MVVASTTLCLRPYHRRLLRHWQHTIKYTQYTKEMIINNSLTFNGCWFICTARKDWAATYRTLCTLSNQGRSSARWTRPSADFFRAIDAIFGKVGRVASEDVVLELVKCKCLPILLYGLECCPLNKRGVGHLLPGHLPPGHFSPGTFPPSA